MPLDPKLLYNIAPKVTASPVTFGALVYKAWASAPKYDESPVKRRGFDKAGRRLPLSKPEGDIWMKNKEKPSRTRGAY